MNDRPRVHRFQRKIVKHIRSQIDSDDRLHNSAAQCVMISVDASFLQLQRDALASIRIKYTR
jgi:hypothetical protein